MQMPRISTYNNCKSHIYCAHSYKLTVTNCSTYHIEQCVGSVVRTLWQCTRDVPVQIGYCSCHNSIVFSGFSFVVRSAKWFLRKFMQIKIWELNSPLTDQLELLKCVEVMTADCHVTLYVVPRTAKPECTTHANSVPNLTYIYQSLGTWRRDPL